MDEGSVWQKLHKEWWGKSYLEHKLETGKVLDLTQYDGELKSTRGKIFIREEYQNMFKRLDAFSSDDSNPSGVIITGQPGTGKSYSLYYFLILKIIHSKPVFLVFQDNTILFDELGVHQHVDSTMWSSSGTWALVDDVTFDKKYDILRSKLFLVLASSPNRERYHLVVKSRQAVKWGMMPWTLDEIHQSFTAQQKYPEMMAKHGQKNLSVMLSKTASKWGYVPRDVFNAVRDGGKAMEKDLDHALLNLNADILRHHLSDGDDCVSPDHLSHRIVRVETVKQFPDVMDDLTVDLKSTYIGGRVDKQLRHLDDYRADEFFRLCRSQSLSAVLAGWSFQHLALNALCRKDRRIPPAERMDKAGCSLSWPRHHRLRSPRHASNLAAAEQTELYENKRAIVYFSSMTDVILTEGQCFVPDKPNFPLLDAVYFTINDANVTVHVLQMTIAATHKGSGKGYDFLTSLKTWILDNHELRPSKVRKTAGKDTALQGRKRTVRFEYHLVVPTPKATDTSPHRQVKWVLPPNPPKYLEGPGYVQHIPIDNCPTLSLDKITDEEMDLLWADEDD